MVVNTQIEILIRLVITKDGRISEDIEYWRADNRVVYERLYQMIMEGRKKQ